MARIKNGILGGFSGKVGSVVGCRWKNIEYIRSLPAKPSGPPSEKQLAARAKFRFLNNWLNDKAAFFATSFINHTADITAMNAAYRFNKDAVAGVYPDFELDYSRIVISRGELPGAADARCVLAENNVLEFSWSPVLETGARYDDLLAVLVCYHTGDFEYTLNGTERKAGHYTMPLQYAPAEGTAHVYLTFINNNRTLTADSMRFEVEVEIKDGQE